MQLIHRTKNQESVNLNLAETRDSVAETQRQTRVSVGGYITGFHVHNRRRPLFSMFSANVRFRNHVFPQSLTCVYVAETRISVPETYYFIPSTGRNVKTRPGNLTDFSLFPSVSVAVTA